MSLISNREDIIIMINLSFKFNGVSQDLNFWLWVKSISRNKINSWLVTSVIWFVLSYTTYYDLWYAYQPRSTLKKKKKRNLKLIKYWFLNSFYGITPLDHLRYFSLKMRLRFFFFWSSCWKGNTKVYMSGNCTKIISRGKVIN